MMMIVRDKSRLWKRADRLAFERRVRKSNCWVSSDDILNCTGCQAEFTVTIRKARFFPVLLSRIAESYLRRRQRHSTYKAPQAAYCCALTSDVSSRQRLRSANRHQLMVPRHRRSTFGRRAFSIAGPMEWNSLPHSLRDPARSTDSFRSALKTHLFAAQRDE